MSSQSVCVFVHWDKPKTTIKILIENKKLHSLHNHNNNNNNNDNGEATDLLTLTSVYSNVKRMKPNVDPTYWFTDVIDPLAHQTSLDQTSVIQQSSLWGTELKSNRHMNSTCVCLLRSAWRTTATPELCGETHTAELLHISKLTRHKVSQAHSWTTSVLWQSRVWVFITLTVFIFITDITSSSGHTDV